MHLFRLTFTLDLSRLVMLLFSTLAFLTATRGHAAYEFLAVATSSEDADSDRHLRRYLKSEAGVDLTLPDERDYDKVIDALVTGKNEAILARTSPYVLVVAQLMGTPLVPIGTYERSDGGSMTYHAFLVVNRAAIDAYRKVKDQDPSLPQVIDFLQHTRGPEFLFKNEFSTSGYFAPVAYLRSQGVFTPSKFDDPDATALTPQQRKLPAEELIASVARGEAALTAAWEGDRRKVSAENLQRTYFVLLPYELPNDLLVCNLAFPPSKVEAIRKAISVMPAGWITAIQPKANISRWRNLQDAPNAATALYMLRQMVVHPQPQSVVRVSGDAPAEVISAVERAISRSHADFVRFDETVHSSIDYDWTVTLTSDGALALKSVLAGRLTQNVEIPFHDADDLTCRVRLWMDNELALVRYVWPYYRDSTVVLRDFDVPVIKGTQLMAQTITWSDIGRDSFKVRSAADLKLKVKDATDDLLKLGNDDDSAVDRGMPYAYDPMSRDAVRVFIDRRLKSSRFLGNMSLSGGLLLLLLGVVSIIDLRRREAAHPPAGDVGIAVREAYSALIDDYYRSWSARSLVASDILYCDRPALEETINAVVIQFGDAGMNEVTTIKRAFGVTTDIPIVKWLGFHGDVTKEHTSAIDHSKATDEVRLTSFLKSIVQRRLTAEFIGAVVPEQFREIIANMLGIPAAIHPNLIEQIDELDHAREEILNNLATYESFAALTTSEAKPSLLAAEWVTKTTEDAIELTRTLEWKNLHWCPAPLVRPRGVLVRFSLPMEAKKRLTDGAVTAWLLGKVRNIVATESVVVIDYDCLALVR